MMFIFRNSASSGIKPRACIGKQDFGFSRQRNILFFIFAALWVTAVKSDGFVSVKCKDKSVGHYGQQSLLECVVQTSEDVQDPSIHVVAWKKLSSRDDEEGQILLGYRGGQLNQKPGYRFAEPYWNGKNMNVSLLITNTAVTGEGLYSCMVITNFGGHTSFTTLKVQAKYSAPTVRSITEKTVSSTDSALICESHGGYPKGELHWFDEQSNDWTKSSEMEVEQTPSGLFQLRSTLHLLRGSTFLRYTCVVFSASGSKEDEITFEMPNLPPPPPPPSGDPFGIFKIVIALLLIGSLIIGLLCGLLLYKIRSQRAQRHSAKSLMGGTTCQMNRL